MTKAVGTLAMENKEKVNAMGLQVDKNTKDIATTADQVSENTKLTKAVH